jgi:hypothetical protein
MSDTVTKQVTGIDRIAFMVPSKHRKSGFEHRTAERGETVELPATEAERLGAYLAEPGTVEEAEAPQAGEWEQEPEDAIAKMTVEQATAYLGQVPEDQHADELERVLSVEKQRENPRAGIVQLDPDFFADDDES